jgi:P4 family phage/plasmid primase-like protien
MSRTILSFRVALAMEKRGMEVFCNALYKSDRKKFLMDVIQDPHKLREFLKFWGYGLLKSSMYEKGAMFVGGGSNGKSVLIKLMEAHEGEENCSHVSMHDLAREDDRFANAGLYGKTLNTHADLGNEKIKNSGNIKPIISGDMIEGQHKHKPRFRFRNHAKIVYSANSPPETDDPTYAFYRRWLVIPFDRTFVNTDDPNDPNRKDPDMYKKLTTPEEMSGALNLRLKYLRVLMQENGFAEESFEVVKREYESRAEHLTKYLLENCEVDFNNVEYATKTQALYVNYVKWCADHQITTPLHETTFGSKLVERGIVKRYKRIKGQGRAYYYMGMALKSELQGENMTTLEQAAITTVVEEKQASKQLIACPQCDEMVLLEGEKELQLHFILNHPGKSLVEIVEEESSTE